MNTERSVPYRPGLLKALRDPQEAEAYRQAALEDGDPNVIALVERDIRDAQKENQ